MSGCCPTSAKCITDISSLYHREFHFFCYFFMYLFLIFIRPNVLLSPFTIYSTPPELGKQASLLRPHKDWAVFPPSSFSLWLNISHLTVYSIWNLSGCGCGWGEGLIAARSLPGGKGPHLHLRVSGVWLSVSVLSWERLKEGRRWHAAQAAQGPDRAALITIGTVLAAASAWV